MAMRAVNEAVAKRTINLPSGYNIFWSGPVQYMLRSQQRLMIVVPLTLLLIILIIYLNTRSAIKTAIVMLAVPFSLVGAIGNSCAPALQLKRGGLGWHHRFSWPRRPHRLAARKRSPNRRNGIREDRARRPRELTLSTPRDRDGTFEPLLIGSTNGACRASTRRSSRSTRRA